VQNDLVTPIITNLKLDPFERFHEARGYDEWQENRSWLIPPALQQLTSFIDSFKAYPPRMRSFDADIDEMMRQVTPPPAGGK